MPFYIVDQADVAKTFYSIWTAAEYGDEESIVAHVEGRGLDPGILDHHGYSAVHLAAQHNYVKIVQYLLDRGAAVDGGSTSLCTPLHRAAFAGAFEAAEALVRHGARINSPDRSFGDLRTPLHKAAQHPRLVAFLLEKGASVDALDANGLSPLHVAAACGNSDSVNLLLKAGAEVRALDHKSQRPAHHALLAGHIDLATHLNSGQPLSIQQPIDEDDEYVLLPPPNLSFSKEPSFSSDRTSNPALGYVDTTTGVSVVVRNSLPSKKMLKTARITEKNTSSSNLTTSLPSHTDVTPLDVRPQQLPSAAAAHAASSIFSALRASDARRRQRATPAAV